MKLQVRRDKQPQTTQYTRIVYVTHTGRTLLSQEEINRQERILKGIREDVEM